MPQPRSKAEAQQELYEKFQLRDTADFQLALVQGKFELAQQWLDYIVENKENFPQYNGDNWESWLRDRRKQIEIYKQYKMDGVLDSLVKRSKKEAQDELRFKFGFYDTEGFRATLAQGEISKAQEWLDHIVKTVETEPMKFAHYLPNWENWLSDRKRELEKAQQAQ